MVDESFTLDAATRAVAAARAVIDHALSTARNTPDIEEQQSFLYDLAHSSAAVSMCDVALRYGEIGDDEAKLAMIFIGDSIRSLAGKIWANYHAWDTEPTALDATREFVRAATDPDVVASASQTSGSEGLPEDLALVADTFERFAMEKIAPHAEEIHRHDLDIPDDIIEGVASLGSFGLSISSAYGGFAEGTEDDHLAMVIATERLSRASLGAGGSLITRPEILARALEAGGTEDQKSTWLPGIASGETICAVAATEPDVGSDVAQLSVTATRTDDGYVLNGVKTWCTFAGRANALMVLARTNPDRSAGHRGLSILIVEKPSDSGHAFAHHQPHGGKMEGTAIPTLGYRGMHSFEVSFNDWLVPAANLIGEDDGLGRGFYLQMAGFENGRLQTAARAVGVMQAAYDEASTYVADRQVFGRAIGDYQLTQTKLGRMNSIIQICRQYSLHVARLMATPGEGSMEASMAKAYSCLAAEWVTREALQLHGGYGYAEEYPISRLFVDARVLSIFEGADETLSLKLIARQLLRDGLPVT